MIMTLRLNWWSSPWLSIYQWHYIIWLSFWIQDSLAFPAKDMQENSNKGSISLGWNLKLTFASYKRVKKVIRLHVAVPLSTSCEIVQKTLTRSLPDFWWLFAFFYFFYSLGCVSLCSHLPCTFTGWVPILDFIYRVFLQYVGSRGSICLPQFHSFFIRGSMYREKLHAEQWAQKTWYKI